MHQVRPGGSGAPPTSTWTERWMTKASAKSIATWLTWMFQVIATSEVNVGSVRGSVQGESTKSDVTINILHPLNKGQRYLIKLNSHYIDLCLWHVKYLQSRSRVDRWWKRCLPPIRQQQAHLFHREEDHRLILKSRGQNCREAYEKSQNKPQRRKINDEEKLTDVTIAPYINARSVE